MLRSLEYLALEVVSLDRSAAFYRDRFGLSPAGRSETERRFDVGETTLVLRRPKSIPRGGLHVHFAFETADYQAWRERLDDLDPEEFDFGAYRSLYVDDPDGHCPEVGGRASGSAGGETDEVGIGPRRDDSLSAVFEVVLEVESLDPAESAYRSLGFDVVDRGDERRRVRLRGPVDLELWEPQLGIADARGAVHADLGFVVDDAGAAADAVDGHVVRRRDVEGGVRVRDADGHYVTFREREA